MARSNSIANQDHGANSLNRIDELAEEFVARIRLGQQPTISEYIQCYPDLTDEINEIFPTLAMLESFGEDVDATCASQPVAPTLEQLGEY